MIRPWRDSGSTRIAAILLGACAIFVAGFAAVWFLPLGTVTYSSQFTDVATSTPVVAAVATSTGIVVTHLPTPKSLRAIYMSSWAAGNSKFRAEINDLLDTTEINAVVIDIKDYTGRISFPVDDPALKATGAVENRIPDIQQYIAELHAKNIYVIGRISSFQDSYLIKVHPEYAVKTNEGKVWQDYKGVNWLDAGAEPVWEYLTAIGRQAYAYGFDELNFDYIRYPSDGNLKDVAYSWSDGRPRTVVMKDFFTYLHSQFASSSIPISADLFGLTTSSDDDLGIGQVLVDALPNFDYVAPMVYPSHFAKGYLGLAKPAEHPYDVIKFSMGRAVDRALSASTSPEKLRPWLQDFNLGAVYTPAMVRAQIQAAYDLGLTSWMLWNAGVVYTKGALEPKGAPITLSSTTVSTASPR